MKSQMETRLRQLGLKVTQPRMALLARLNEGHGPFSPEELHGQLDPALCDLVTVYRSLSTFEELGLVRRCNFGDGKARYELQDGNHHHHHLVCRKCGAVKELEKCVLDTLESSFKASGYQDISHSLEFFGTCPTCA